LQLTKPGRTAFQNHVAALHEIVNQATLAGAALSD
jgi:hypothetical protein